MSEDTYDDQNSQDTTSNDKEYNFRKLENKYESKIEQMEAKLEAERQARLEAERRSAVPHGGNNNYYDEEDDEDDDPYVDTKKLKKTLNGFKSTLLKDFEKQVESKVQERLSQKDQERWLEKNSDFYDTIKNAEEFAKKHPKLAKQMLKTPEGFERQKLVYYSIKAFGLDKPKEERENKANPAQFQQNPNAIYYQPSGVATAPYNVQGDYSQEGQKSAYEQMQALKNRLNLR